MADPVTWPVTVRPRRQTFWLASRTTQFDNPFHGTSQRIEWQSSRWRSELVIRRMGAITREIDALVASLNGPVGTVLLPDFRRLAARGLAAGAPQIAGGIGSWLDVTGFVPDTDGVLLPGDLVQIDTGRAAMITAAVASDSSGNATIPIAPPLRAAIVAGPMVTTEVRVLMRLVDDDQPANPTAAASRGEWQLAFEEVLS